VITTIAFAKQEGKFKINASHDGFITNLLQALFACCGVNQRKQNAE